MGKQHAFGSKLSLSLAVAVSAVLTACGGGGGGSSTPTTPVAPNTPAATTHAATTNTPAATTPAANNTQPTLSSNQAMYEQLRTQCQVVSYTSEAGFYACAAGTYVGKNLRDGQTVCTVRLTRDGDVTYTMGNEVYAFKLAQHFFYSKSAPLADAEGESISISGVWPSALIVRRMPTGRFTASSCVWIPKPKLVRNLIISISSTASARHILQIFNRPAAFRSETWGRVMERHDSVVN